MPDIAHLIQAGAANPWLYLPVAVLLGALHALEPGHSKSMMAAFIVAVRGTPAQATLLGVSAAFGHTLVVWAIALVGLSLGSKVDLGAIEPWLIVASGLLIVALAFRLLRLIHDDHHEHDHHDHDHASDHHHHDDHKHDDHKPLDGHAAAHAREISQRFAGRKTVSNADIAWFGLTGGLLPCPAAIAVLLVCLQLKQVSLGLGMVAAFSVGLAITLVAVGLAAAWGAEAARTRWSGFDEWGHRLPYMSAALVAVVGIFMTLRGLWQLGAFGHA